MRIKYYKGEHCQVDEMARMVLEVNETKSGNLPLVCMYCGEAASQSYRTSLGMWPRSFKAQLPLCQLHKNHFRWRSVCFTVGLPLLALFLIIGMAMCMTAILPSGPGPLSPLFHFGLLLLILAAAILLGSMGAFVLLWSAGIKGIGPQKGNVVFYGVALEFIEALRVYREDALKKLANPPDGAEHEGPRVVTKEIPR